MEGWDGNMRGQVEGEVICRTILKTEKYMKTTHTYIPAHAFPNKV